jgi:capsule polysaccharide export protein KpsE/RkpR
MKSELILESLSKLDPENKDHWTQNGQPLLSAVGEGVTRSQILEVAPLFSRENPVLPSQETLTDDEVQATIEDKVNEIADKRERAAQALKAAIEMKAEADKLVKEATDELEALREEQKSLDPRSPAQINIDLLKASFAERLRAAGAQQQARRLLEQAGLVSELKELTASPVDRAIAQRIQAERRKKLNGIH